MSDAPQEKVWRVEAVVRADNGEILRDPVAVREGMLELGAILSRVGGTAALVAERNEVEPGRVETTAIIVRYRTFSPIVTRVEEPLAEEGEVEVPDGKAVVGDEGLGIHEPEPATA